MPISTRNLLDNHTHSHFSDDSKMDIREAVKQASENHLGGIVITDHYDYEVPSGVSDFKFDPELQQKEIDEIRQEIPYDFKLLKGIEIGLQHGSLDAATALIQAHHFDAVIASQHFIDHMDPYHGDYYLSYDWKGAYQYYLEVFYQNIQKFSDFNILGHFDYVVRYAPYPQDITMKDFGDIMDAILKLLIERGQTFEINTKTYQYYNHKTPQLDPAILKRFKELGGEGISFGSDAHNIQRLGEKFDIFSAFALSCGIKYEVYFEHRNAHFLSLED